MARSIWTGPFVDGYLLKKADLVFTGGVSLFEAKRRFHPQVYPFPSGVDLAHFAQARSLEPEFGEQAGMPRPRLNAQPRGGKGKAVVG